MNTSGNNKKLLIYGARLAGRQVRNYLAALGQEIDAFLDRDPTLHTVDGIPVFSADRWAADHNPADACMIIGLFNNHVDMADVFNHLEVLGYRNIVSLVEFVRRYPDNQPFRYWLVAPGIYEAHVARISAMRAALEDAISKELLDSIVEFRTHGDARCLPPVSVQQYFPADLPSWPKALRFIDCGTYTGDTVQELQQAGFQIDALATFEPNIENYRQLTSNLSAIENAIHFPCGVSDSNRISGFDPSTGAGGHLVDFSDSPPVFCVRLDDALRGFNPNLIKMDIEGEEAAALRGAEQILRTYQPNLAIAVYHRAEHLWEIFEQIQAYDLGYRFYLRCHAHSTFDTVLYAVR